MNPENTLEETEEDRLKRIYGYSSNKKVNSTRYEEHIANQLRVLIYLMIGILLLVGVQFGYGLYRQAQIKHCATEEAQSAPQQAACIAIH